MHYIFYASDWFYHRNRNLGAQVDFKNSIQPSQPSSGKKILLVYFKLMRSLS